ncbi:hypothetical protein CVD28_01415 [Bacillus sp. M6-12]|uniref:hypothetical protein n=1 Tax=Bacillus sp. M6-12 TaxID=2054166 RepID=UPI000C76CE83|nr:hypothetical protein [Bacillus sp. M6-12]PLS19093.1 hypothetical protein CVD28_01415 [Bacillus sp. M6-12]
MKKLTIGVCFLSLLTLFFSGCEKPSQDMEMKKETEQTAPSVEEVIQTASADKDTPSPYLYRGAWIGKSGNNLTRLEFRIENNSVVNGFVLTQNGETSTYHHAPFTGMIQGDTIEGVFKEASGKNGTVSIEDKGEQLVLKVSLTNDTEEKKGISEGEYELKKDVENNK